MAFGGIITLFVGLTVAIVLVGSVVIPIVYSTNTGGWDPAVTTFYTVLLPIVIVAALLLLVLR